MLQTKSAAHVLNINMNQVNEDTHNCDLNLYETIFQNVCLTDGLSAMTPDTNDYGVAPLSANHSNGASPLPQEKIAPPIITHFTLEKIKYEKTQEKTHGSRNMETNC